jgi:hypothetical protein
MRCPAKVRVIAPVPRHTAVEIPIAAHGVGLPLRQIADVNHSTAPHIGQVRHRRSSRRWATLMPGGKTTSRYLWTPCRLGQISIEPHRYSPSSILDQHRASARVSRLEGRRRVSGFSSMHRRLRRTVNGRCAPNAIYTVNYVIFTGCCQVSAGATARWANETRRLDRRSLRSLDGKHRLGEQRDDGVVAARHVRAVGRLLHRTQIGALDHVGLVKQDAAPRRV